LTGPGPARITDGVADASSLPAENSAAERPLVLVVANDFSLAAAKTSRHLALALERIGYRAVVRDTRLNRWGAAAAGTESPARQEAFEAAVVAKWTKLVDDYGVDLVLSLDLHWMLSRHLFVPPESRVRQIHSLWFDDLRSHLLSAPMFPLDPRAVLNGPKVTHHCYGAGQAEELRLLGIERVRRTALAAPAEYLRAEEPCTERDRLAFIGNPGLPTPPTAAALAAMDRGARLVELRALARQEMLDGLAGTEPTAGWLRQSPGVRDLLAVAMERRLSAPHVTAAGLLVDARSAFPDAFDFLNRSGLILDAALLVKMVNRYDRPALVRRLWKRGWLEVYGMPDQWKPFGIDARPTVPFPDLPAIYRRHAAHLNASNCARDASANEKLFEIAACARLSLNLDSPDVRACYPAGEIVLAEDDEALEAAAEKVRRDPDAALAAGETARAHTAREHLWENRLEAALR
jgi:hypothetical protein